MPQKTANSFEISLNNTTKAMFLQKVLQKMQWRFMN
jgi:hypothetical protein